MVDLPSGPLAAVDAEFEKMALETGGFTFGLPGTSVREKLLQVTAHDICRASFGLPFKMHVLAMSRHGVPYADMLALIRFVASRTRRAWSEERLSPRERAFVALTAHVTQRALGESFRRHVELALKVASADDIRDAVRFTAEMGVIETCAALEELEKILATS
ncbi:dehydrogenase [Nonomuraea sp. FMUSA5-5]|uniref:Dehydrogenase n=1 Tax=Nonomuraea composti TaxID=2720023 RepID=A0ABX1B7R8_9ACTN|nr:dehydrogenase [Nonomuraea sp. FMUSA5-5]NJP92572.1 dehydrogenase [Nonomuraea sp. FMUSA5-5]